MSHIAKIGTDTVQTLIGVDINDKTLTWSHTLVAGANRLIVVCLGGETFDSDLGDPWVATSVTYGGVVMTKAIGAVTTENGSGLSNNDSELWYLFEADLPADGSKTVIATCSNVISGAVRLFSCCSEYENVDSQLVGDVQGIGYNQTVPSDTIGNAISLQSGDWVFSSYVSGNAGSWTVGQSQVEILDATLDSTVTYGACELRGAIGTESILESTFATTANRLTRVAMVISNPSECYDGGSVNNTIIADQHKVNTVTCETINEINAVVTQSDTWLGTWQNRRKITIAAADVDETNHNFPMYVNLSTSSGKGSTDVSDIFDEVGANSMKIAATASNGVSQLFVEVVYWDDTGEEAELWIRCPYVYSDAPTEIYLYYDNAQSDNTIYVGDVNSTPGEAVWDSNFVGVWHLAETTGNYLDSTNNNNDSSAVVATSRTTIGLVTPDSMELEHDNSDTGIVVPAASPLALRSHTLEALVNFEAFHAAEFPDLIYHRDGATANWYSLELTNDPYEIRHRWSSGSFQDYAFDIATGWNYLAGTVDVGTATAKGYKNDDAPDIVTSISLPSKGANATTLIGGDTSSYYLDGTMDEVRISNIARSEGWIDLTYQTLTDNLITWSAPESI